MNFRGILSKSSSKSSSSAKSLTRSDEILQLQSEIESLKETIDSLKVSVESREAAIGTLAREKEKIYIELKTAQRTNRNLHQQLIDERDIHSKEKEFLINEIKRLSKRSQLEMELPQDNEYGHEDPYKNFFDELKVKDEVIYCIGAKYMKMKATKISLQKRLEKLQVRNQKTCEKIIFLLQDNRKSLNNLLDDLTKSSNVSPNSKKYLNLLQINAGLHFENTQLKIYMSTKDCNKILQTAFVSGKEIAEAPYSVMKHSKIRDSSSKISEIRQPMIRSKLTVSNNQECPDLYSYKYIDANFLPCQFKSKFYRSASDTCIIKRNLSEFNIVNRN